ncbi:MAG: hypothetical protein KJZ95_25495, partial [Caldilinea sp.]|nr:hypothetical protein [Caldilinea sp.]
STDGDECSNEYADFTNGHRNEHVGFTNSDGYCKLHAIPAADSDEHNDSYCHRHTDPADCDEYCNSDANLYSHRD